MTILKFPAELQEQVFNLIGGLSKDDKLEFTIKLKETISPELLEKLKALNVQYLQPVNQQT